jgi:hypothetical protein
MIRKLSYLILCLLSQLALAAPQPDGDWKIISKSCNSQPQAIAGNETVFLRSGFYAQSYLNFEDPDKTCYQAQAFDRIIQSFSNTADKYEETSNLRPNVSRTVCRSKATGQVISDDTVPADGSLQVLSIVLHESNGTADINGSSFCKDGVLHLEIQKKKAGTNLVEDLKL